jgi:hypothetical protein
MGLSAQTSLHSSADTARTDSRKVNAALVALRDSKVSQDLLAGQMAQAIISIVTDDRHTTQLAVDEFARELTRVLHGRQFSEVQAIGLTRCITNVVQAVGISNFALAEQFREALRALGLDEISTRTLTQRFLAVGESVRGPDDSRLPGAK